MFSFVKTGLSALRRLGDHYRKGVCCLSIGRQSPGCLIRVFGVCTHRILRLPRELLPDTIGSDVATNSRHYVLYDGSIGGRFSSTTRRTRHLTGRGPTRAITILIGTGGSTRRLDSEVARLRVSRFGIDNGSLFGAPRIGLLLSRLTVFTTRRGLLT